MYERKYSSDIWRRVECILSIEKQLTQPIWQQRQLWRYSSFQTVTRKMDGREHTVLVAHIQGVRRTPRTFVGIGNPIGIGRNRSLGQDSTIIGLLDNTEEKDGQSPSLNDTIGRVSTILGVGGEPFIGLELGLVRVAKKQ
jgi:hypothetical protein